MKRILTIILASLAFATAISAVYANDTQHPRAEAQKTYTVKGEVVAIDKTAGKVKLKHEAVPALEWPAMTMFFPVADRTQLDTLQVGAAVEFRFAMTGGAPLIMQITPLK